MALFPVWPLSKVMTLSLCKWTLAVLAPFAAGDKQSLDCPLRAIGACLPAAVSCRRPPPPPIPHRLDPPRSMPASACRRHPPRKTGLEFAQQLQPFRSQQAFQEVADALNGLAPSPLPWTLSGPKPRPNALPKLAQERGSRVAWAPLPPTSTTSVYADAVKGSDASGDGTEAKPFASLTKAVSAVRATGPRGADQPAAIILRDGTFHLPAPLELGSADSYLAFQAYPGEQAVVSGALPLSVQWQPHTPPGRSPFEFRSGALSDGFDVAPAGMYTVDEAKAMCANMPACAAFGYQQGGPSPRGKVQVSFKAEVFWTPGKSGSAGVWVKNYGYQQGPANLFKADLSGQGISAIEGLRVAGHRAIRARYPNVKTVEQLGAMQVLADKWTHQPMGKNNAQDFTPAFPLRNDTVQDSRDGQGYFQTFKLGIGGPCAQRFTPQASYWCTNTSQGGGPGPYSAPVGMTVSSEQESLPHLPYPSGAPGAIVHSWRAGRWFSWAFEGPQHFVYGIGVHPDVQSQLPSPTDSLPCPTAVFNFSLERGGNQGSRGGDAGQEFFIENVLEELDSPGEFYYDSATSTLYLWHNSTEAGPPGAGDVVYTHMPVMFNISGTQDAPVRNVSMLGLTVRDSSPFYMGPHGTPAGGDWAVERSGAVFMEGVEGALLKGCLFTYLDANAVFVSSYARNVVITENEFLSIGETAISQWGTTDGSPVPGMGFDATKGNQPRGTEVSYNLVHEVGLWTKQNSFYFQSSSFGNHIVGNIGYNGPRAGINFDDGMGGGSRVEHNVLFNFCRESSDHGPFNSWDRVPYLFDGPDGKPTVFKQNDTIAFNWVLANYHSSMAIDNDDGSCFYDTHDNVFISASSGAAYGGNSLKSDFGGHSNFHHGNLDLFWSEGFGISGQLDGYSDGYYNNYLYMAKDGKYGGGQACKGSAGETIVGGNTIWTPTGTVTECGMPLEQYQKQGGDQGTKALPYPEDSEVLQVARKILNLQ
eukprot:gene10638-1933_t